MKPHFLHQLPSAMVAVALIACVAAGCGASTRPGAPRALRRHAFQHAALGTTFHVLVYAPDADSAERAATASLARLGELESALDASRPGSEVARLSEGAGGPPRRVSDDLFEVLRLAQRVGGLSDGAFDVTAAPYRVLWGSAGAGGAVTEEQIAAAGALVGRDRLHLDPIERTARLADPGMRLDLTGVACGYAADRVLEALSLNGTSRAMVEAAGGVGSGRTYVLGDPPPGAAGWPVSVPGVRSPHGRGPAAARGRKSRPLVLSLSRAAVAFSPNWRGGGRGEANLLDPLTGRPANGRPGVVVLARRGAAAESLAAAAAVLGRERGEGAVTAHKNARAWFFKRAAAGAGAGARAGASGG